MSDTKFTAGVHEEQRWLSVICDASIDGARCIVRRDPRTARCVDVPGSRTIFAFSDWQLK